MFAQREHHEIYCLGFANSPLNIVVTAHRLDQHEALTHQGLLHLQVKKQIQKFILLSFHLLVYVF